MTKFMKLVDELVRKPGESDRALSIRLGLHESAVNRWPKGVVPRAETIRKFCQYADIDASVERKLILISARYDIDIDEDLIQLPERKIGGTFLDVPKVGVSVAAGGGANASDEKVQGYYAFRRDYIRKKSATPSQLVLIDVDGDSMEPDLRNGDTVMVDRGVTLIKDGEVYCIGEGDNVYVKILQLGRARNVWVVSRNPCYEAYERALDEIRVVGRVIWSCRDW